MGKLILVGDLEAEQVSSGLTAVYAPVSSAEERDNPDRQVARVLSWAVGNGFSIECVVTGVGSGVDDDLVRDMTEVLTSFSTRLDAA